MFFTMFSLFTRGYNTDSTVCTWEVSFTGAEKNIPTVLKAIYCLQLIYFNDQRRKLEINPSFTTGDDTVYPIPLIIYEEPFRETLSAKGDQLEWPLNKANERLC